MKRKILMILLLVMMIAFNGCAQTDYMLKNQEKVLPSPLANPNHPHMQDLAFLMEQLRENHPSFDEAVFLSSVEKVADRIPQMDSREFNFAVCRILADMGDAHTEARLLDQETDRMIPLWQIKHYEEGWFIDGIHESSKDYLGCEILEINGTPMDAVVEKAKPYFSHETDTRAEIQFADQIKNSAWLKYLGVIEEDFTIPMTLRNPKGEIIQAKIQTFAIDDYEQYGSGAWISRPETAFGSDLSYYSKSLKNNALFVQYAYCHEREDYTVPEFIDDVTAKLATGQYQTLIFDLRFNMGGMFPLFKPAVDAVGRYAQEHKINLYCLIGEQTFSSGLMHAVQLKEYGATLVGRPTGGKVNFYADTINVQLPNSGIPVSLSTGYNEVTPKFQGIALEPDILVSCRHKDVLQKIDGDIQAVFTHARHLSSDD